MDQRDVRGVFGIGHQGEGLGHDEDAEIGDVLAQRHRQLV
jgi:hypothetical protein